MGDFKPGSQETGSAPTPDRVAARALALAVVVCRADLDERSGVEAFWNRVREWARALVESEFEPSEMEILDSPLGSLDARVRLEAGWRAEGLTVLAWSLGHDLPAYDETCRPTRVAESLGFLKSTPSVLRSPALRPYSEIASLADQMFALSWRLREFSLRPEAIDFPKVAGEAWFGPLDIRGLQLLEGDLAIRGMPVVRSSEVALVTAVARERQRAANWLIGENPIYSDVDVST